MRLIDADAIVLDYGGLAKIHPHDCRGIAEYFAKQIDAMPTIEPERKTGRWVLVTDNNGQHCVCPYCGEWKYHQNQKFCGECGAKMEVTE